MRLIDADAVDSEFLETKIIDEYDVWNILDECPTIQIPQWISVQDRLPNVGYEVIIAVKLKPYSDRRRWLRNTEAFTCQGLLNTDDIESPGLSYWEWCTEDGYIAVDDDCEVTHWMPLPEPPKEEE